MSNNIIAKLKNINWQDPTKYKVNFTGSGAGLGNLNSVGIEKNSMSISNIQLAEMNTTPIEEYTAEEWRFALGRLENLQLSINFKDFDNFTLYKIWAKALQKFLRKYPDDIKFNIEISTANSPNITSFSKTVTFKDCILITVSPPTLDHSAISSIAEFSVIVKCSYVDI